MRSMRTIVLELSAVFVALLLIRKQLLETKQSSQPKTNIYERVDKLWFMNGGVRRPTTHDRYANIFPEDLTGSDRIVEQLMYTLPETEQINVKIILLANGINKWQVSEGRDEFLKRDCPVHQCLLTADYRDVDVAHAILFRDRYVSFNVTRNPNQIWIMSYKECPFHTPFLPPSFISWFNWTATYRRDSDIVVPYEKWVYYDPLITESKIQRNYAANKTKKVAWFVSNCHARNHRLQYARQLARHIKVDVFGLCGRRRCPRPDDKCLQILDKHYKFYLSFENSNCRDYVTEKFFVNGLQREILPVVMGAHPAEYASVAPRNSYIHVNDFASAKELAIYLHKLDKNDTLYNSYFKWKGTGEFINTHFFCRVCAMLHAGERRRRAAHYEDVQAWWRDGCFNSMWADSANGTIVTVYSR